MGKDRQLLDRTVARPLPGLTRQQLEGVVFAGKLRWLEFPSGSHEEIAKKQEIHLFCGSTLYPEIPRSQVIDCMMQVTTFYHANIRGLIDDGARELLRRVPAGQN